jgi:hypothetical protein
MLTTSEANADGVQADTGGAVRLVGGTVTTSGTGSLGLFVTDANSQITATNVAVSTTFAGVSTNGNFASAFYAQNGGSFTMNGGSARTAGVNVYVGGSYAGGTVNLTGATITATGLGAGGLYVNGSPSSLTGSNLTIVMNGDVDTATGSSAGGVTNQTYGSATGGDTTGVAPSSFNWAELGARVSYRFSRNLICDIFVLCTVGEEPAGSQIHGSDDHTAPLPRRALLPPSLSAGRDRHTLRTEGAAVPAALSRAPRISKARRGRFLAAAAKWPALEAERGR